MKGSVGIITPPWLTVSGKPEMTEVSLEGEGAALRLASAAGMSIDEAQSYLDFLATGQAEYDAAEDHRAIGHA